MTTDLQTLKVSTVRNVERYIKVLDQSRIAAARRDKAEARKLQAKARDILESIPGGLGTVNIVEERLVARRRERSGFPAISKEFTVSDSGRTFLDTVKRQGIITATNSRSLLQVADAIRRLTKRDTIGVIDLAEAAAYVQGSSGDPLKGLDAQRRRRERLFKKSPLDQQASLRSSLQRIADVKESLVGKKSRQRSRRVKMGRS